MGLSLVQVHELQPLGEIALSSQEIVLQFLTA